jgi:hypothetical protein
MAISSTSAQYGLNSIETNIIDGTSFTATVGREVVRVPMPLVDIGYTVTIGFDGSGSTATIDLETGIGTGQVTGVKATGTITFTGAPVAGETVTVNGTVYTFAASAATATEITIGATVTDTAANAASKIDANESNIDAVSALGVVTLSAKNTGTYGNAYTLAEAATNTAVSGATFSGGVNAVTIDGDGVDYLGDPLPTAAKIHGLLIYATAGSADVEVSGVIMDSITSTSGMQSWSVPGRVDLIANLTITSSAASSQIKLIVRASE